MSDLSRLLDDVYGGPGAPVDTTPPAAPAQLVGLPDWATDSVLDDAFAEWVPGPATVPVDAFDAAATVDAPVEHLERAFGGPGRSAFGDVATQPVAVAPVAEWSRGDDDILPSRRTKGSKRGGSSAVADETVPSIEMFAASEDQPPARRGRLRRGKG